MASSPLRRIVGALASALLACLAVTGFAGAAHAEDGYQYWNYFHLENDAWEFSMDGPAEYQPKDGAVEAFRYGTSTETQGIEPRVDLAEVSFDTVCADQEAAAGEKRVAVVLDYGTDEGNGTPPQPRAECAVVDQLASTQDILGEIAEVRVESGLTCAIDGYPATGCGEPVKNAQVPADEQAVAFTLPSDESEAADEGSAATAEDDGGTVWPLVGVGAAVVALGGGAYALSRRNRAA